MTAVAHAPLLVDVSVGDTLQLTMPGPDSRPVVAQITVEKKSGQVARLRIRAADAVAIKVPPRRPAPGSASV